MTITREHRIEPLKYHTVATGQKGDICRRFLAHKLKSARCSDVVAHGRIGRRVTGTWYSSKNGDKLAETVQPIREPCKAGLEHERAGNGNFFLT